MFYFMKKLDEINQLITLIIVNTNNIPKEITLKYNNNYILVPDNAYIESNGDDIILLADNNSLETTFEGKKYLKAIQYQFDKYLSKNYKLCQNSRIFSIINNMCIYGFMNLK